MLRAAALSVVLMVGAAVGPDGVGAQGAVDYDADDDGLIEIEWLEQLDAVRSSLRICRSSNGSLSEDIQAQ